MTYFNQKLVKNESILYKSSLSWVLFINPLVALALSIIGVGAIEYFKLWQFVPYSISQYKKYIALAIVMFFGVLPLIGALLKKISTSMVITDKRLLYKRGLIAVDIQGMPLNKIETVESKQTFLGRILSYGTIIVKGSGSTPIYVEFVSRPMCLRSNLAALIT